MGRSVRGERSYGSFARFRAALISILVFRWNYLILSSRTIDGIAYLIILELQGILQNETRQQDQSLTDWGVVLLKEVYRIRGIALCETKADHIRSHARELLNPSVLGISRFKVQYIPRCQ
jgi:hypothetical protein